MIVITGNNGEGSGLITNYAIEKLLEENIQACIILLDDTSEFNPLRNKLNGTLISIGPLSKPIEEQISYSNSNNDRFFQFRFNKNDIEHNIKHTLEQIKKAEIKLASEGGWVFVIFKSTHKDYAYFIQKEYEKLSN